MPTINDKIKKLINHFNSQSHNDARKGLQAFLNTVYVQIECDLKEKNYESFKNHAYGAVKLIEYGQKKGLLADFS